MSTQKMLVENAYYQPAIGRFLAGLNQAKASAVNIAFFGSSSVQGSNASTVANRFVDRLMVDLQAAYPNGTGVEKPTVTMGFGTTAGPGLQGKNFGVGGTHSGDYYFRSTFTQQITDLQPFAIFHQVGSNDWANSVNPATYKTNLLAAIADMDTRVTRPHVHILTHAFRRSDAPVLASPYRWEQYREVMRSIALDRPNDIAFIDLSPIGDVNLASTADPLGIMDTDLIHPTDFGHLLIKEGLLRGLQVRGAAPVTAAAASSSVPGHTLAEDHFVRADATSGGLGVTPTGKTWTTHAGTWGIDANQGYCAVAPGTTTLDCGMSDNIYVSMAGVFGHDPTHGPVGVIARATADGNRVGVFYDPASVLGKVVSIFVKTPAGNAAVGTTIVVPNEGAGKANSIGMKLVGNKVTSYFNGREVASYTMSQADADIIGPSTNVGIRISSHFIHRIDSWSVKSL